MYSGSVGTWNIICSKKYTTVTCIIFFEHTSIIHQKASIKYLGVATTVGAVDGVVYLRSALTTALALRFFRSVYVCPVPTNTIG